MDDVPESGLETPSRRSRDSAGAAGLSVADLLARHGASGGAYESRRVRGHRLLEEDETARFLVHSRRAGRASGATQYAEPDDSPTEVVPRVKTKGEELADGLELRARKIDESLVRLTAIHAGMGAEMTARVGRSSRLSASEPTAVALTGAAEQPPLAGVRRYSALVRTAKAAALALAVLVFAATGVVWGARSGLDSKLPTVAALDLDSDLIVDKAAQRGDENFLLVGVDSQAAKAPAGAVSSVAGAPPDTIMVAHIPAGHDRAVLLAFPGDLEVDRPNCDRWDPGTGTYPGGTAVAQAGARLSTAFEIGGPRCVTKAVQKLTGLSINHFTAIDIAGLKEMVDALGGVPICLTQPAPEHVAGPGGPAAAAATSRAVLVGYQALAYVRDEQARGNPAASDERIEHQQRFLSALLRRDISDRVLFSPAVLSAFITAFSEHTLSDHAGLAELTPLVNSLSTLDPAKLIFVTIPGGSGSVSRSGQSGQSGQSEGAARRYDPAELFAAIRTHQPLPGEGAGLANTDVSTRASAVGTRDTLIAPGAVTLTVRNGSVRRARLANDVADSLRSVGFTVSGVRPAAPTDGGRTLIRHSPDRADQAVAVMAAVPAAINEDVPGSAGLLELVVGDSFDGVVKAAAAAPDSGTPAAQVTLRPADGACR